MKYDFRRKRPSLPGLSIVIAGLVVVVLIVGLLVWSGYEVDLSARKRDRAIASLVLEQNTHRVAHAQESSTVWDEAVRQARRRPLDMGWIDINLGTWFHEYAGFDEVYLLSPGDVPIYAMRGGRRVMPETFIAVEEVVGPLAAKLRRTTTVPRPREGDVAMLSPGVTDLAVLRGRPAIVSVKPIVTDSGLIVQAPGTETIHVSVVYLDTDYFSRIGADYGLSGAKYQLMPSNSPDTASLALKTAAGKTIGYLVWTPFAPGHRVIRSVGPVLLLVLLLSGAVIYFLAHRLARRTMDLEQSRSDAEHQAMHDALTGLPNRTMFENRLEAALSHCRRHHSQLALLYLDLDHFKQVNDSLGHPAGDELIRQVAHRLTSELRGYDLVARLGGDEFAVLMVAPASTGAVKGACVRIVAELERPFDVAGTQAFIGGSIGIAMAPDDGLDATDLTRKADIALYKAKMGGRGRYLMFDPSMDEDIRLREAANRELREALADRERQLKLLYQPIYAADTGRMVAVETLLRWDHPDNGLVTPDAFIRLAEESGQIEIIGSWVLRKAMQDAQHWPDLRVSVNVSPIQVRNRTFVNIVKRILAETGIQPCRLELELTETALMSGSSDVAGTLRSLRDLGIACALDDFGTGYSSLSHIRDIAVDRIKIDRSFVQAVDTAAGAALVEAIVGLARANGLRLTAEGVETEGQLSFLRRVGCHELQGYFMSRPVPAEGITRLLSDGAVFLSLPTGERPDLRSAKGS